MGDDLRLHLGGLRHLDDLRHLGGLRRLLGLRHLDLSLLGLRRLDVRLHRHRLVAMVRRCIRRDDPRPRGERHRDQDVDLEEAELAYRTVSAVGPAVVELACQNATSADVVREEESVPTSLDPRRSVADHRLWRWHRRRAWAMASVLRLAEGRSCPQLPACVNP